MYGPESMLLSNRAEELLQRRNSVRGPGMLPASPRDRNAVIRNGIGKEPRKGHERDQGLALDDLHDHRMRVGRRDHRGHRRRLRRL